MCIGFKDRVRTGHNNICVLPTFKKPQVTLTHTNHWNLLGWWVKIADIETKIHGAVAKEGKEGGMTHCLALTSLQLGLRAFVRMRWILESLLLALIGWEQSLPSPSSLSLSLPYSPSAHPHL